MVNDAANKSYVDGVKQTATYFFNYEMGRDSENETKFWKSTSKYAVPNDSHFTLYSEKLTFDMDGTYEFH